MKYVTGWQIQPIKNQNALGLLIDYISKSSDEDHETTKQFALSSKMARDLGEQLIRYSERSE